MANKLITYGNLSRYDSKLKAWLEANYPKLEDGKVVASQLPGYVDDVVEGYYSSSKFYSDSGKTTEITGETGKIYVDLTSNKTYRYSGSAYVEISSSLALGETSSTAYRGDRGKTAYTHAVDGDGTAVSAALVKVGKTAHGHVVIGDAVAKSDITGLLGAATSSSDGYMTSTQAAALTTAQSDIDTLESTVNGLVSTGGEPNQNAFTKVAVGSTTVAADAAEDTLTLVAGSNVTLTADATNDKITIAATNTDTHYASSTVVGASATATANAAASNGSVYLNHIENSAVKSSHQIKGSGAATVTSDANGVITVTATNTTYSAATTSAAGLMSAADKTKLNKYTNEKYWSAVSATYTPYSDSDTAAATSLTEASASANGATLSFVGENGITVVAASDKLTIGVETADNTSDIDALFD